MFNNEIVIAAIRPEATETLRSAHESRLASAISAVRATGLVDVVVVFAESEQVLAEARELDAVDRQVAPATSTTEALAMLRDSDDGWVDEQENPWLLEFDLGFDLGDALEVAKSAEAGAEAGAVARLSRLRSHA